MTEKLTHFPINWIDGMKINKSHFIDLQNFMIEGLRDNLGIQTSIINYGLLPYSKEVQLFLAVDSLNHLKVKVQKCHGITPNGTRIAIDETSDFLPLNANFEAVKELKDQEKEALFVCIAADPFNRLPCGEPDAQENPPRDPYTSTQYSVQLFSTTEIKNGIGFGNHFLIIGRVIVTYGEAKIDSNYIPPCISVNSHKKLQELHFEINRFYGQMEVFSIQIQQKIRIKNQPNPLAIMVEALTEKSLYFLSSEINRFRWFLIHQSPVQMFASIASYARVMKTFIDAHAGAGKEELLNYFAQWCNVSQGTFENTFSELINSNYDHNHIGLIVSKIQHFITLLEGLFSTLNRLDYIGKKPDGSIFVSEVTNDKNISQPVRNNSFLVD